MTACACEKCRGACARTPGWFMPDEALAAIEAGLAPKLMVDWWEAPPDRIYVLSPASEGYEGGTAPEIGLLDFLLGYQGHGRCAFFDGQDCAIHASGYKPHECAVKMMCDPGSERGRLERVADAWATDKGLHVLDLWRRVMGELARTGALEAMYLNNGGAA